VRSRARFLARVIVSWLSDLWLAGDRGSLFSRLGIFLWSFLCFVKIVQEASLTHQNDAHAGIGFLLAAAANGNNENQKEDENDHSNQNIISISKWTTLVKPERESACHYVGQHNLKKSVQAATGSVHPGPP
jgi:hypothetical protein